MRTCIRTHTLLRTHVCIFRIGMYMCMNVYVYVHVSSMSMSVYVICICVYMLI